MAERLEIHYTPKHGSWLNMAEIELSVLKGSALTAESPKWQQCRPMWLHGRKRETIVRKTLCGSSLQLMLALSFIVFIRNYNCYMVLGTYRLNAEIEACIFVMQSNQRRQQQKMAESVVKDGDQIRRTTVRRGIILLGFMR